MKALMLLSFSWCEQSRSIGVSLSLRRDRKLLFVWMEAIVQLTTLRPIQSGATFGATSISCR